VAGVRARVLGTIGAVLALGSAACASTHPDGTISSRDRAACAQLGAAYARFNAASSASASSIRVYRKTIAVAGRADDAELGGAITLWASRMIHPEEGPGIPGAPYATQRCNQIGEPLRLASSPATSPSETSPPSAVQTPASSKSNDSGD
jgi:hypothetical protein